MLGSFTASFLLIDAAFIALWRRYSGSRGKLVVVIGLVLLLQLYCTPIVSRVPAGWLETRFPRLDKRPDRVAAIVVLSGNIRRPETPTGTALPGEGAIFRCVRAAELYRDGDPCPVIVSGGISPTYSHESAARIMGKFMVHLGVAPADIVEEPESRTTHENALYTARLLRDRKIDTVVLVTDGLHVQRAALSFDKEGVDVVPAGCAYRVGNGVELGDFLPQVHGAATMSAALHEVGGLIWYWMRGYI